MIRTSAQAACAAGALVAIASGASAVVSFTNGSLNGPIAFSSVPTSWTNLPQGTTDTISAAGHPFAGFAGIGNIPFVNSPDGGTFAWSGDSFLDSPALPEGLSQTVLGLTVGATYKITFQYANLGLYDAAGGIATNAFGANQNYASAGRWVVKTGVVEIGATPAEDYAPTAAEQVWKTYSVNFVASLANIPFRFESDWVSGNGTHVGMGIDGLTIEEVPAPGVLATSLVAVPFVRRRRSA